MNVYVPAPEAIINCSYEIIMKQPINQILQLCIALTIDIMDECSISNKVCCKHLQKTKVTLYTYISHSFHRSVLVLASQ